MLTSLLQACCEHILLTSCEIFTCVAEVPLTKLQHLAYKIKISQLVNWKDVFATGLYVASLSTSCNNIMLLFHQVATRLSLTTCGQMQDDNKFVVTTCNKSVELNNFVASCQQAVDNLSTSWEQAVRTHPVDKLLEQHCYKSAAGLLQLVRFTCVLPRGVGWGAFPPENF